MKFLLESQEFDELRNYFYDFIDSGFSYQPEKEINMKSYDGDYCQYMIFLKKAINEESDFNQSEIIQNIDSTYFRLKEIKSLYNFVVDISFVPRYDKNESFVIRMDHHIDGLTEWLSKCQTVLDATLRLTNGSKYNNYIGGVGRGLAQLHIRFNFSAKENELLKDINI